MPLAGATVRVKGTKISTVTDQKGVYVLEQVDEKAILIVSYVGYNSNEFTVNGKSELNITLQENTLSLNSVVVIGYGTAKKKDVVGAVDVISAKTAGATTSTNISELLIGKAAGVQVVQANGTPGSDAQIIIRGTGSFTSVDPLYVIDGVQGDKNLFNTIASQDIETITILKDASATAIYGVGGANGVVLVTTKRAHTGAPKISFLSQWGVASPWKRQDLLNASQYVTLLQDFAATSNTTLPAKFSGPTVLVDSNNWQNNIFRNGLISENDISLSGGTEKVLYIFSAGYQTQQSVIKDYNFRRFNTRFSLDENLGIFHLGEALNIRYTTTDGTMAAISDAIQYAPYKPIYDPTVQGGYSILTNVGDFSNVNNPLQNNGVHTVNNKDITLFPQLFGEVDIIRGLKFRTQFSAEIDAGRNQTYQYPYTASNNLSFTRQATLAYYDNNSYTWENYFSYNKIFGKNGIGLTLGTSYISPGYTSYMQGTGSNLPNDDLQNISAAPTQSLTSSNVNYYQPAVISYFGRLIYTFDDKYILSASIRRDGASNFGSNYQYGNFPGLGVAWKFSDEDFVKRSLSFISEGKLRAGWGRTGNNHIANFLTTPLLFSGSPSGNLNYSFGTNEAFNNGITITSLANPNLRWETTDQTDIGIDLGFMNNHLTFTADWYLRKSSGLLVNVPLPASVGASSPDAQPQQTINAADAQNSGIEFSIGYQNRPNRDFGYNINANISYNKNYVNSLGSQFTAPIKAGTVAELSTFTITQPGSPIGSFYGYEVDHVASTQAEIDALNAEAVKKTGNPTAVYQQGLLPGDFIFKDLNGSGTVTDSDQAVLGNPIPKFVYGFNAGVTYKDFDLNLVISGVAGLKILNSNKFYTDIEATGHNAETSILNRWRASGDIAALPRAGQDVTANGNLRASDWWLENGDYFRIRNLTIGYTLSKNVINSFAGNVLTKVRIYIAAQNLLTITKYSGYDPEISTQNGGNYIFTRGIDDNQPPQPRTFMAGIQLGF
jgi:TonB-dependent starch-binding outer membrane protein SusC